MLSQFGWKSALATLINAGIATMIFRKELGRIPVPPIGRAREDAIPMPIMASHVLILFLIVLCAHHPSVFMGLFLFFMGIANAYPRYQNRLILREGLLVAFFLGGLVVLGGMQNWWLQPTLHAMDSTTVYFGATVLTAFTDNAALTYLGSLVTNLSDEFKYSLVAGAVTGGGLTVIANAPNPAGMSILRGNFDESSVNPLGLFVAAAPPTITAILAFQVL
jgi:Na+/H+ antiporter NhaD/arsenite permease-like protein